MKPSSRVLNSAVVAFCSLQWKQHQARHLPGALYHVWAGPATPTERWHQHGHNCDRERQVGFSNFIINIKSNFHKFNFLKGSIQMFFLISGWTTKITTWSPDCTFASMQRSTAWAHFQLNSPLHAHLLKEILWFYEKKPMVVIYLCLVPLL